MKNLLKRFKGCKAFTLIELLVVVLIVGILAAIAVPQYMKMVEKGKVTEALNLLDSLHGSQERYLAQAGNYCGAAFATCAGFDLAIPTLKYFNIGTPSSTAAPSWTITLTRNSVVSNYGAYTVNYTVTAGQAPVFVCTDGSGGTSSCQQDLMPQ